ncbi:glycogen synthase [Sandaracinomonas limnophila]|uniref:starch synthase n=1 Tax=Sandaracinomonas limnophila TaxID=1862386 RepID=A0A437PRC8_9BACT|nr:glycogen/starch synthase [Sandaracinomonas limnophila]RVU24818.1 glycogen synthase [Sandaracinomonas limnophila]
MRILYVSSEVDPFLNTSKIADFVRNLPTAMQEKGIEIRILVPRFGLINERKNRLHEVVRLSGITIPMGEEDKPLTIKVASIPAAKLQVYFIDNEDYFQRKSALTDKDGEFFADNHERAIFFCKGALETVIKLGWSPDVIHCNDWMTSFVPMYIATHFRNHPIFKDSKTIFSPHNSSFDFTFDKNNLFEMVKMGDIEDENLGSLAEANYDSFIRIGSEYADKVISLENAEERTNKVVNEFKDKTHQNIAENDVEFFENVYKELAGNS